ncbi:hypothetical protein EDD85DRAFT_795863 [Armillaria nabsnona]|nr:hypothetical protein EDD85DRAFT_795863 [Armillaria nabsnona]
MEIYLFLAVGCIAYTLVIWDYLISIEDEVALFWACSKFIKTGLQLSEVSETVLKTIVDQIFVLSGKSQYHDSSGIECVHYDDIRIATSGYFSESGICSLVRYDLLTRLRCGPFQQFTTTRSWTEACYLFIEPDGMICVGIQLIVMESITVVRAWAIMGRQHRVLWAFLGLLTLSTIASLVFIPRDQVSAALEVTPIVMRRYITAQDKANHAVDVRRFDSLLCDTLPLCMSVASITVTRMLLRLRKQALFDSAGPTSVQEELSTFRVQAVSEGINSSSEAEEDRSL